MEFLNFPIVALGAALVCLIGVTIYAHHAARQPALARRTAGGGARPGLRHARALAGGRAVPRSRTQAHGRGIRRGARIVRPHLRRRHRVRAGDRRSRGRRPCAAKRSRSSKRCGRRRPRRRSTPRRIRSRACIPARVTWRCASRAWWSTAACITSSFPSNALPHRASCRTPSKCPRSTKTPLPSAWRARPARGRR